MTQQGDRGEGERGGGRAHADTDASCSWCGATHTALWQANELGDLACWKCDISNPHPMSPFCAPIAQVWDGKHWVQRIDGSTATNEGGSASE